MTLGAPKHPIRTLCAAVVVLATLLPTAAAAQSVPAMSRVRSEDPRIGQLIADAPLLSTTFRDLVIAIDATNGLVYVESGQCGRGARACLAHSLQVAGPHRLLRVLVQTGRDRRGLIAAIGHELHHALEVLNQPAIRTTQAMFFHFFGASMSITNRFETKGADEAGRRIGDELRRTETRGPPDERQFEVPAPYFPDSLSPYHRCVVHTLIDTRVSVELSERPRKLQTDSKVIPSGLYFGRDDDIYSSTRRLVPYRQ
jgi:hypothetical protein